MREQPADLAIKHANELGAPGYVYAQKSFYGQADGVLLLERLALPEVWRASIAEALAVIELLDQRIAPIEAELAPLAQADRRVQLLRTIPGLGSLLADGRGRDR